MIFGIQTHELPNYDRKELKFYWGALNRARIAVMAKIFGPVFLITPFMLAALKEENFSTGMGITFFLIGLFLVTTAVIVEKPEFLSVSLDKIDGLCLYLDFYGFIYYIRKIKIQEIVDVGIKCDFERNQVYSSTHSLVFLCKDGKTFKVCLNYSISQTPDNELLRLARFSGEIANIMKQPAIISTEKIETQINPQTGLISFKGTGFNPK